MTISGSAAGSPCTRFRLENGKSYTDKRGYERLLPGDGTIDYVAYYRHLLKAGWSGHTVKRPAHKKRDTENHMITRRNLLLQSCLAPAVLRAAKTDPEIGFATGTYGMKTMSTADALRTLAEIGYDGVELCFISGWPADPVKLSASERKDLRKLLGDTGLAAPAILENLGYSAAPQKRAQNLERLKLAVDLCNELVPSKPPVVDTILGGRSSDWDKLKNELADIVGEWGKVADATKTTVCFKPHADQAVDRPDRAIWLQKQVNNPRIRIIYDYGHFFLEGFTLAGSLQDMLPYTAFISVKDSARLPNGKHEYLLPGDGKTDYLEYFRLLKQHRYSGWVGVEVSALIHNKPGYQPVPTARLCYERLAPLMAKAGVKRPARTSHKG
jgi:inosose dehydratase